jgi:hypothetical protein
VAKVVLTLAALLLAACATGGTARTSLIGQWRYADAVQTCQYVFLADGTFSGFVRSRGELMSQFSGNWAVRDNAIFYEYTKDKIGRIPAGTRDRDRLINVAADHFVIQAADGSMRKYVRIG